MSELVADVRSGAGAPDGAGEAVPIEVIAPSEHRATIERLRRAGGTVQTTFALPPEPWDLATSAITCIAEVGGSSDAADALIAALRRSRLVVVLDPSRPWPGLDDFLEDVLRLGSPVPGATAASDAGGAAGAASVSMLSPDQRQILTLLAEGRSLPDVAAQLFLSLRTAERRLGAARRLLGVRSTAEALAVLARSGS